MRCGPPPSVGTSAAGSVMACAPASAVLLRGRLSPIRRYLVALHRSGDKARKARAGAPPVARAVGLGLGG